MNGLLLLSQGWIIGLSVGAVVLVLAIILIWYISTYNKLQALKNRVEEGWATIDVQLKKRYDLIPNLVETVKGYASHESKTLEAVIEARNAAMTAKGDDKIEAEKALTSTLKNLFSLKENYPQLKANANFMDLQQQLRAIETEIASARRYYNGTVKEINTKIDMFFAGIVARKMHLEKRKYFELDSEEERKNVSIKF
ncbi:MAG: LemA family protein [Clostridia bacterium]|nr:LemA family protein [Clostridia bacterium]